MKIKTRKIRTAYTAPGGNGPPVPFDCLFAVEVDGVRVAVVPTDFEAECLVTEIREAA